MKLSDLGWMREFVMNVRLHRIISSFSRSNWGEFGVNIEIHDDMQV